MECSDHASSWLCDSHPTADADISFHEEFKFWITEPSYNLRPEVIESYYYAFRMTHDHKYRDWAWEAFLAINASTRMEHGFNYLRDVRRLDSDTGNNQESYFFSETLKYLWLIFDEKSEKGDNDEWHVNAGFNGEDMWVYNTEGHPLKVRERPVEAKGD
jgi:mannosyl-oligosaccharide alpha-1,2-mannosidase